MNDFPHRQTAHCESGVTANLLTHHGLPLSEPLAFGIGAGIFFGYFPFLKINGLPLTTFRTFPGAIFSRVAAELGVRVSSRTFRSSAAGMAELDRILAAGSVVGAQTGVFWLPYFPPALRFHFNAHNLVILDRQGEEYRISDPVMPEPVLCPAADLERARFARGALAPKGKIYWVSSVPASVDPRPAVTRAIRRVCLLMLKVPFPLIGVRGIEYLAREVERWPRRLGRKRALQYLGNVIRMQEEIGTGGGGFRFIYAAFLQEAAELLDDAALLEASRRMTAIGDRWRDFALVGARHCKGREESDSFDELSAILRDCAGLERQLFRDLDTAVGRALGRGRR